MKNGVVILGALAAVAIIAAAAKKCPTGAYNPEYISLENIRRGVSEGWYEINGLYASGGRFFVSLKGKTTDGEEFVGTYEISASDFNILKIEGYPQMD